MPPPRQGRTKGHDVPPRPPRPCRHPGCNLLAYGGGYCDAHRQQAEQRQQQYRRDADKDRGSRHERGYDSLWVRNRRMYLAGHPLCERCEAAGRTVAASLVHHRNPIASAPSLRLDADNLQALCRDCHEQVEGRKRERHA